MGTPDFAVHCLNALIEAKHEIICVVAQPDKAQGRGKKILSPPTIVRAKELLVDVGKYNKLRYKRSGEPFTQSLKQNPTQYAVVFWERV